MRGGVRIGTAVLTNGEVGVNTGGVICPKRPPKRTP
jgi:hypothetical protein